MHNLGHYGNYLEYLNNVLFELLKDENRQCYISCIFIYPKNEWLKNGAHFNGN